MTTIYSQNGLTCTETEDGAIIFEGGKWGEHRLCSGSSRERILAHWKGYVENNGFKFIDAEQVLDHSRNYQPGDVLLVHRNQGWRDAMVLGIRGDQMIVEYDMPAGTTALLVGPRKRNNDFSSTSRSISYRAVSQVWIDAIAAGRGTWDGDSQTGHVDFPGGAK